MRDFQGAEIAPDTVFLLPIEMDEHSDILAPLGSRRDNTRSRGHGKYISLSWFVMDVSVTVVYEEFKEMDFLRLDGPAQQSESREGHFLERTIGSNYEGQRN